MSEHFPVLKIRSDKVTTNGITCLELDGIDILNWTKELTIHPFVADGAISATITVFVLPDIEMPVDLKAIIQEPLGENNDE